MMSVRSKRIIYFLGFVFFIHNTLLCANYSIVGIGEDGKIKRAIKSNYLFTPPSSGDVGLVSKGKIYGTSKQIVSTIKLVSGKLLIGGINDPLLTEIIDGKNPKDINDGNKAYKAFKENVMNTGVSLNFSNQLARSTFMSSASSLEAHSDSFYYANACSGEDVIMTNNAFFYGNLKIEQQLYIQSQAKIIGDVYAGIGVGCTKSPLCSANYQCASNPASASRIWGSFVSRTNPTEECFIKNGAYAVLIYNKDGIVQDELNKTPNFTNLNALSLPRVNSIQKSVADLPYYNAEPATAFRTIHFTEGATDNFFVTDDNSVNNCLKTRFDFMNYLTRDSDVLNLYFNLLGNGAWVKASDLYSGAPPSHVYKRFIKEINFSAVVDTSVTPHATLLDKFNEPSYRMSSNDFKQYVQDGIIVLNENDPIRVYATADDSSKDDIPFTTGLTPILLDTQGYYVLGDGISLGNSIQNNCKDVTFEFHTNKTSPVFRIDNFEKLKAGNSKITIEIYDPDTQLFFTTGLGDTNNAPYNIVFMKPDASCTIYVNGDYNCWSNGTQYINSDFTSAYLPRMYDSRKLHFYISGDFKTRGKLFISSIMEIGGNLTTESENLIFIGSCKANGYIDLKNDNAFLVPECILDSGSTNPDLELKSTMEVNPKSF